MRFVGRDVVMVIDEKLQNVETVFCYVMLLTSSWNLD